MTIEYDAGERPNRGVDSQTRDSTRTRLFGHGYPLVEAFLSVPSPLRGGGERCVCEIDDQALHIPPLTKVYIEGPIPP